MERRQKELASIAASVKVCQKCVLSRSRKIPIAGEGPVDADIVFVGEAPGAEEDRYGKPFIGKAGKIFDQVLNEVGLQRSSVFITNVVKCRPPKNRDPLGEEIESCLPYLFSQFQIIQPKKIICLGRISSKALWQRLKLPFTNISKMHGHTQLIEASYGKVMIGCMHHPAAVCYQSDLLQTMQKDLQHLLSV
jgi:DNA polymerase